MQRLLGIRLRWQFNISSRFHAKLILSYMASPIWLSSLYYTKHCALTEIVLTNFAHNFMHHFGEMRLWITAINCRGGERNNLQV